MRSKTMITLAALLYLAGFALHCDKNGTGIGDNIPPAALSDLTVQSVTDSSITLTWTAPGDDQTTGTASMYDLRFNATEISETNWDAAHQAAGEPEPNPAGAVETFVLNDLTPATKYYLALKTADEVPNWSTLSNLSQATTSATAPKTWARLYGTTESDGGKSVLPLDDGGFVVAGWTRDTDSRKEDFYLLKVNASGDRIWENAFGGEGVDYAWSIVNGPDDGFVVAGLSYSYGAGRTDAYIVRTDAMGQPVWNKTVGGWDSEEARSITRATDGAYVFAGYAKSSSAGMHDGYLVKVDTHGIILWEIQFGGSDIDMAHGVAPAVDGGFIVVGETRSFSAGDRDIYLIKVDAAGDTIWSRTFGGEQDDIGYAVTVTSDGGYMIAGATESSGAGDYDALVLKIDELGDSMWSTVHGGSGYEHPVAMVPAVDGGFVLAGYTNSFGAGRDDLYLIKIGESGDVLWEKTYGGAYDDRAAGINFTQDGGYIVTGWTKSWGAGSADLYLLKIDEQGNYDP